MTKIFEIQGKSWKYAGKVVLRDQVRDESKKLVWAMWNKRATLFGAIYNIKNKSHLEIIFFSPTK